jgi:hypothetical protein
MGMAMHVVSVAVWMLMKHASNFGRDRTRRSNEGDDIHHPEDNQHQTDGKLHGEADTGGDYHIKKNDDGADDKNRQRMTDAPEDASHRGFEEVALAADNRRNRNHMVWVGRVPHAEKKAHRDDREKSQHRVFFLTSLRLRQAARQGRVVLAASFDSITRNYLSVPLRTKFRSALLRFEVDVVNAESLAVTIGPLVVIEQAPQEVAFNWVAF